MIIVLTVTSCISTKTLRLVLWVYESMSLWVSESTDPRVHGSTSPRVHESTGPRVHGSRVHGSTSPRFHESTSPRVHESTSPRVHESTGPRVYKSKSPLVWVHEVTSIKIGFFVQRYFYKRSVIETKINMWRTNYCREASVIRTLIKRKKFIFSCVRSPLLGPLLAWLCEPAWGVICLLKYTWPVTFFFR